MERLSGHDQRISELTATSAGLQNDLNSHEGRLDEMALVSARQHEEHAEQLEATTKSLAQVSEELARVVPEKLRGTATALTEARDEIYSRLNSQQERMQAAVQQVSTTQAAHDQRLDAASVVVEQLSSGTTKRLDQVQSTLFLINKNMDQLAATAKTNREAIDEQMQSHREEHGARLDETTEAFKSEHEAIRSDVSKAIDDVQASHTARLDEATEAFKSEHEAMRAGMGKTTESLQREQESIRSDIGRQHEAHEHALAEAVGVLRTDLGERLATHEEVHDSIR